ncbi:MAG: chalcone isomerase family protein [Flavobacteriaceae bacterium]|nr:chalcone isomerase family protein [Flavobacteriaceae bacterium]
MTSLVIHAVKSMPENLSIESNDYYLCKEHTIKYAYVIKIAYVGLYLKDCNVSDDLLNVDDKFIRFNYQVNVKAKVFIDAADEFFMKNLKQSVSIQELDELKKFNNFYQNIEEYEYYDLYHKQGQELILYKNNEIIGKSYHQSFSYKYFNIWFGKYPAVKPLKRSFS